MARRKWFIFSKGSSFVQRLKFQYPKLAEIKICNIFSFSQSFLPFWLAESGLYSLMCWNQDLQQFLFVPKYFGFFPCRKFIIFAEGSSFLQKLKSQHAKYAGNGELQQF